MMDSCCLPLLDAMRAPIPKRGLDYANRRKGNGIQKRTVHSSLSLIFFFSTLGPFFGISTAAVHSLSLLTPGAACILHSIPLFHRFLSQ